MNFFELVKKLPRFHQLVIDSNSVFVYDEDKNIDYPFMLFDSQETLESAVKDAIGEVVDVDG